MFNFDKKSIELLILALGMIGATYNAQATTVTFKVPSPTYNGPEGYNLPRKGETIHQSFTVPEGITKVTITATGGGGGGGGGGGAYSTPIVNSRASGGGGGGGGSTVKCTFNLDNTADRSVDFIVGNGGEGGTGGKLGDDGQSGKAGSLASFLIISKYVSKSDLKYTRVRAEGGSPGLGGSRGTITGAGPGGSGGAGGRGDVTPNEPNCTIMNGESGTAGGSNGPPQKAGAAGKAGSNSCGAGDGGAGGEGGIINNSTYAGTSGSAGTNGGYACVTFEY